MALLNRGSSTSVGGTVYVPNIGSPAGPGACPDDFSVTGNPHYGALKASTVLPVPKVNIPPNASVTDLNVSGNQTLVPGTPYRNVNVSGNGTTLTLTAPGVYNFNSLTVATHATLTISPANKAVTINITGAGTTTPISMDAHATMTNSSGDCREFANQLRRDPNRGHGGWSLRLCGTERSERCGSDERR